MIRLQYVKIFTIFISILIIFPAVITRLENSINLISTRLLYVLIAFSTLVSIYFGFTRFTHRRKKIKELCNGAEEESKPNYTKLGKNINLPKLRHMFEISVRNYVIKESFKANVNANVEALVDRINLKILIFPILLVLSLIAIFYLHDQNRFALALIIPLLLLSAPYELLVLKLKQLDRASSLERELPFVSIYLTMIAAVGIPLSNGLEYLRNSKVLRAFRREIGFIKKISMFYGTNMLDSLEMAANEHPSRNASEFYRSIVAIERSGGDRFSVLRERSKVYFKLLEERVNALIERFGLITNISILVYVLIPLGLLIVSIIFAGNYGVGLVVTSSILIPIVLTILLIYSVKVMIPHEIFETPPMRPAVYTLISLMIYGLIIYYVGVRDPEILKFIPIPLYLFIAISMIIILLPAALYYYNWMSKSEDFIYSIPIIARHIAEEAKKGFTPKQSLMKLSGQSLGKHTSRLIKNICSKLLVGYNIEESVRDQKMPWLAKVYFELLSFGEKAGIEPKSLDELAEFMTRTITIRRVIDQKSVGFIVSAFITIIALVFSFVMVRATVFEQILAFSSILRDIAVTDMGIPINPIDVELKDIVINIALIGIVINSFLMGIITGHVTKGHPLCGIHLGIIFIIVALVALAVMPSLVASMGFQQP